MPLSGNCTGGVDQPGYRHPGAHQPVPRGHHVLNQGGHVPTVYERVRWQVPEQDHGDHVQRGVRGSIAAGVQPVTNGLARRIRRDRIGPAEMSESGPPRGTDRCSVPRLRAAGPHARSQLRVVRGVRCRTAHELRQVQLEDEDLGVEGGGSASRGSAGQALRTPEARRPCFGPDGAADTKRPFPGASCDRGVPGAQRVPSQEGPHLHEGGGPGLDRTVAGHLQLLYRLDDPGGVFRYHR
jgi:hypothetical protein